jgi:hypothetical protein
VIFFLHCSILMFFSKHLRIRSLFVASVCVSEVFMMNRKADVDCLR